MNRAFLKVAAIALTGSTLFLMTACDSVKVPDEYNYDDFSKYIDLGAYEGLTYEKVDAQVTSADVQEYINSALSSKATKTDSKTGTVASDSTVKIDYVGKINGKKVDGCSGSDVEVDIADNNFIAGFAEGIIGHSVGDKFDLALKFPDNYSNSDLAGKSVVFSITIKAIEHTSTPEYNDEFVKNNTKYKTTAEYEKAIKKQLLSQAKTKAKSSEEQQVFTKILTASKVKKYPNKEFESRYNKMIETYKSLAKQNDMDYEKYLKTEMGMSKAEFEKTAKTAARNTVKQELVLHAIADKEGIKISDSEYKDYLKSLLKDAGYTEDSYKEATGTSIEQYAEDNNLYSTMLYTKVMEKVMKTSKATN